MEVGIGDFVAALQSTLRPDRATSGLSAGYGSTDIATGAYPLKARETISHIVDFGCGQSAAESNRANGHHRAAVLIEHGCRDRSYPFCEAAIVDRVAIFRARSTSFRYCSNVGLLSHRNAFSACACWRRPKIDPPGVRRKSWTTSPQLALSIAADASDVTESGISAWKRIVREEMVAGL
jgi:hypothetical protein